MFALVGAGGRPAALVGAGGGGWRWSWSGRPGAPGSSARSPAAASTTRTASPAGRAERITARARPAGRGRARALLQPTRRPSTTRRSADPVDRHRRRGCAARPEVAERHQPTTTTQAPALVSTDRHATYAAIQLRDGDEDAKLADLDGDAARRWPPPGAADRGRRRSSPSSTTPTRRSSEDITRAELLSLPILLVLLIFIFRGLVAAADPAARRRCSPSSARSSRSGCSTRSPTSRSSPLNVITMLGLGMAIDYALFVVSRFREELAAGARHRRRRSRAPWPPPAVPSGLRPHRRARPGQPADLPAWRSCDRWRSAAWPPCWSPCSPR